MDKRQFDKILDLFHMHIGSLTEKKSNPPEVICPGSLYTILTKDDKSWRSNKVKGLGFSGSKSWDGKAMGETNER